MPRFNPLAPPPKPKIKAALAAIRLPDGDIAITAVTALQKSSVAAPAVVKPAHGGTITLTINNARELVELRFPVKPDDATRAEMKAAKFRWYGPAGCWYHKHTPENLAWAQAFLARHNAVPTTPAPAAPTNPLPTITPPPSKPATTLTLSEQIHEAWLRDSQPEERTRANFSRYYRQALIKAGKSPVAARWDGIGNCLTCGECGRCPGWHYEGEFPNRALPAAPPAPVYIPPLPPLPGMTPLGLAPLKNVTSTTPPSSVPAWRKRLAR